MIKTYAEFVEALLDAGFSMGTSNTENIFALCPYDFSEANPEANRFWHTGDPETDPWEWRIRVLSERDDIAYAKVFFRKSGYITKDWYPCFLAARRGGKSIEEEYFSGTVSRHSKLIYEVISEHGALPVHDIKRLAGFGKEDKSAFERAITELQMKMYITMCGAKKKISQMGLEFGWSSTEFCTVESFFGSEVFEKASGISSEEATEAITEQIYRLNPKASEKNIARFING